MNCLYFDGTIEENFLGHIMAEVYKDRVYAPFLEGRKDLTILDVGSHVGITVCYFTRFAKRVIAVEPDKKHFEALIKNTEGLPVESHNVAIADKDGTMEFYGNDNRTMLSLMPQVADPKYQPVRVTTMSLESLLKDIPRIDFMKLDVEGKEQDILQSEGFTRVAPKIDEMVLEVHSWTGRHSNQLMEALKNNGYKISTIANDANLWHAIRI